MSAVARPAAVLGRVGRTVRLDLGIAWRHLLFGVLAGSALVPRPLRWAVYRAAGLDVRTLNVFSGVRITGHDLSIGEQTFVNHDCYLDAARGRIEIGAGCHLAPEVMVLTATHGFDADGRTSRAAHYLTTRIEDDVWLGARVTVLPGAVVESGCVVAAGAVVTGTLERGGVYAGVPARRIREVAA
ncbi:acyltransferase [Nocardioides alkalitolerans]|uniref:acyltransferase n=1 Tax=Nocardioides alkalitolerans TaxID=281714 RepID=UPI0004096D89|nr:acyltransferase [Nocardioides alkalitolerans]